MCKVKFQSDELVDMISSTVRKMNNVRGDLRVQVLLTSVRKNLKSELGKKQRKLRRKYKVVMNTIYTKQNVVSDVVTQQEETHDDILGLDDFFSSLKKQPLFYFFLYVCDKAQMSADEDGCG